MRTLGIREKGLEFVVSDGEFVFFKKTQNAFLERISRRNKAEENFYTVEVLVTISDYY